MPVSTAAATANTDAVRIGNAPITTDKIVAAKIANRCHACAVNPPGGGMNQIASATASESLARCASVGCASSGFGAGGVAGAVDGDSSGVGRRSGSAISGLAFRYRPAPSSRRDQDLVDLRIGQDVLLAHQLDDALARFHRLGRELGRPVVADHRIERRDRADAGLDVVLETSSLAVIPSTQYLRSVFAAFMNIVCASKMQAAMTGSNALSCSCPSSAAIVTAMSLPMTR